MNELLETFGFLSNPGGDFIYHVTFPFMLSWASCWSHTLLGRVQHHWKVSRWKPCLLQRKPKLGFWCPPERQYRVLTLQHLARESLRLQWKEAWRKPCLQW